MGFRQQGEYVGLPWNDKFNQALAHFGDQTYQHEGADLQHAIHKQTIEATWISIRLYRNLATRLAWVIALQIAILIYLLYRFGL